MQASQRAWRLGKQDEVRIFISGLRRHGQPRQAEAARLAGRRGRALQPLGTALRPARKARRKDMEQQAQAFHPPMFDL